MSSQRSPASLLARLAAKRLERLRLSESYDFSRFRDNPVGFAHEVLGLRTWRRQRQVLNAIRDHDEVAVRSGHKVSKTKTAVIAALWWVCTRTLGFVVVTATTFAQVKSVFWKELRVTFRDSKIKLPGELHLDPATGYKISEGRGIVGISTDKAESMAGFSGPEMLFIADEASGVATTIFEAIEGNRAADGTKLLMTGNPTQTSGTFFEAFTKKRDLYHPDALIHISSEETPNITGEEEPIPGLAGPKWLEKKRKDWGVNDPRYQVRVLGNFPSRDPYAVIPFEAILKAHERWAVLDAPPINELLHIGVDVARFGDDDSVIQPRRGCWCPKPNVIHGQDTKAIAQMVRIVAKSLRRGSEPIRVKVDGIGVGAGVVDELRDKEANEKAGVELEVVDINVSEVADDQDKYPNLRSQLWFDAAKWIETEAALEPDDEVESDLLAPRYTFDPKARQVVESKKEIKKRIGRSPDRADALVLAAYEGGRAPIRPPSTHNAYRLGEARGF